MLLDVGTDNEERLENPIYIGWRHKRVRGPDYDAFVETFVRAVERRWPHVLLQWEDFAGTNAARLLAKYRDRLCTFNDDIQGTAAVVLATLLAAMKASGASLREQRIGILGFGSAGIGIANLLVKALQDEGLTEQEARGRIYAMGRPGLLVEGAEGILRSEWSMCGRRRMLLGGRWRCEEDWARRSGAEREDHGADWGGSEGGDVHGGCDSGDGEERGAAGHFSVVEPDVEVRGDA